ncbi:MAG: hypothetical protein COX48_03075 [bacterium (Candidatus Stahlbacteria) CG23_combo_of_CG06-09_8_20_14_all_34_7]|nr:MAG: hypothetical protein COX48_03075 [bacterium (Candidatus Stahlbacteria) CG23_combo_of_CG06-09_8_20_14_all_34_7]
MIKDIIESIKQSEQKAKEIIADSRKEASEIISKAETESRLILKNAQEEKANILKNAQEKGIKDAEIAFENQKAERLKFLEQINVNAKKRIKGTIEIVVKDILK